MILTVVLASGWWWWTRHAGGERAVVGRWQGVAANSHYPLKLQLELRADHRFTWTLSNPEMDPRTYTGRWQLVGETLWIIPEHEPAEPGYRFDPQRLTLTFIGTGPAGEPTFVLVKEP